MAEKKTEEMTLTLVLKADEFAILRMMLDANVAVPLVHAAAAGRLLENVKGLSRLVDERDTE